MILALIITTLRETLRRSLPWAILAATLLLAAASRALLPPAFASGEEEIRSVAISAVLLAGLASAILLGTPLVVRDLERGTLTLILAKPTGHATYLVGRTLGLFLACAAIASSAASLLPLLFAWIGDTSIASIIKYDYIIGCAVSVMLAGVVSAASIAASCVGSRATAPMLVLILALAGNAGLPEPIAALLPEFRLFGLASPQAATLALLAAYSCVFSSLFLTLAYIVLSARPPMRGQG
ncbi:MAG: hypothetical protein ACT4PV_07780 [Planctomycetaceae bacterium]